MQYRFCILSLVFLFNIVLAQPHRGMWVVRHALKSDTEIQKLFRTSTQLNITDLYVQVYALGKSQLEIKGSNQKINYNNSEKNFQKIISFAKANNIKVHAWLNMFYVWSGENLPTSQDHPIHFANKSVLRSINNSFPELKSLRDIGIEGYFIDPVDQKYQVYLNNFLSKLCSLYPIDGIHLDYIRYPQREISFSASGRTEFMLNYFIDPVNGFTDSEEYIQKYGFDTYNYLNKTYFQFLNQNLNDFLTEIKNHIKHIDPSLVLSCAVKADLLKARFTFLQSWDDWLSKNLCDRVLMMNYDTVNTNFVKNLENPRLNNLKKRVIVGISTYNQGEQSVFKRINWTRKFGFAGYTLFSFNHLSETPKYTKNFTQLVKGGKYKAGLLPTSF